MSLSVWRSQLAVRLVLVGRYTLLDEGMLTDPDQVKTSVSRLKGLEVERESRIKNSGPRIARIENFTKKSV